MPADLSDYKHISGGKVREIYEVDDQTLLMVASDRISAFDFSLEPAIPDKGRILTATSMFFFDLLEGVPNHLVGGVEDSRIPESVLGRAMVVKKLDMVPFECVARGFLTGSGKKEYDARGKVCGVALPEGLVEASKLPEPIFTPATKAEQGDHDENVTFEYMANKLGAELAEKLRDLTLQVYTTAAEHAAEHGIILADTKLEFGLDADGTIVLADEVLTPDSSRYWPADSYEVGKVQPSFDKQYVRNWLTGPKADWDPASGVQPPELPGSVVEATRDRYIEAYERLSGKRFADWPGA
ncbi:MULTISPECIES: phosphoribosylaminoimidazolesuccinocarboxamide synthase [Corynebacterium]|uniref:phosphoribosylaminoimidazolesuccinocarboxamide synthase n=1 Tax=Corynebacterium TaxID=1716 RepID=UPI0008A13F7C|nr:MULTISPECIES: phosphoribosylaminoimidazolesuccinocarboxamide synthase [Corynebacterium]MDK7180584.1 phosphoribosylaminoimidazolesuccinocarboxamide synthase [Corynebacterium riegelii]OFT76794.1 phosphoribosylaminoimidazolesuccinocarboxamide synthase [Corynebacterium sp. HMSC30G07]